MGAGAGDRVRIDQEAMAAAERLHGAAIRMLRRLRVLDEETGMSGPRLSALSVIVFGGPITIGALATAEQVRPATISRMVTDLERDGLVRRRPDPADRRSHRVVATARGRRVLKRGKARRVEALAEALATLPAAERRAVGRAAGIVEQLFRMP